MVKQWRSFILRRIICCNGWLGIQTVFGLRPVHISLPELTILDTNNSLISNQLKLILRQVQNLEPNFLAGKQGFRVQTELDFDRNWGLGSHSNLALEPSLPGQKRVF